MSTGTDFKINIKKWRFGLNCIEKYSGFLKNLCSADQTFIFSHLDMRNFASGAICEFSHRRCDFSHLDMRNFASKDYDFREKTSWYPCAISGTMKFLYCKFISMHFLGSVGSGVLVSKDLRFSTSNMSCSMRICASMFARCANAHLRPLDAQMRLSAIAHRDAKNKGPSGPLYVLD